MIRSILTIKTKAYIFQTLETNPRLQGHHFFTTETTKTIKENIFRRGINYTKDGKRIWNKRWFRKIVRVGRVLGLCAAVWAGGYQLGTLSVAQDPQTFYRNLMRQTLLNCECNSVVEINESEPLVSSLYVNGRTPTIVLKDEQTQTYSKVMATHPGHPMWVSAIHSQRVFHRIKEAAHDFAVGMIEEIKRKQSAAEREGNGDGDVNVNEVVNHVSTSEASLDGNWTVRWLNGDTERITVRSGSWTFPPGTTYTLNEDGCSFTWPSDGTVQTLQTNTTAASPGTLTWSTTNADYPTIFWDSRPGYLPSEFGKHIEWLSIDTHETELEHWLLMERQLRDDWKLVITDNLVPNAFVNAMLPRRVFINVGLLNHFCKNDDQLAAVLGHELSHVLLSHSENQMYVNLAQNALVAALVSMLDFTGLFGFLFELGAFSNIFTYTNAAFSRADETAADHLGEYLATMACFKPEAAVDVWENAEAFELLMNDGEARKESLLDSHPMSTDRATYMEDICLPVLVKLYQDCNCKNKGNEHCVGWGRVTQELESGL